jgi:hypothetical protein
MRSWTVWWSVALLACNGDPKQVDTTGDDDDATGGCTVDDECEALIEVCGESGGCEPGDRDDTFDAATPLFLGDEQAEHGVLATEGDVDTYAYDSPGDEWVSVRTIVEDDDREAGLDTVVSVFRSNGALHGEVDDYPVWPYRVTGFDSVLYVYLPTPGTWFVTVQDASSYYADQEPLFGEGMGYDVLIREAGSTGETDSVTTPGARLEVPDGDTIMNIGVLLQSPGDVDFLEVVNPGDQLLELWSQPGLPGSEATPVAELYDGDVLLARKEGLGEQGYLSWLEARAGTFRIELSDAAGGGSPDHWLPLFARTYNVDDSHPFFGDNAYTTELEPNDTSPGPAIPPQPEQTTGGGDYVGYRVQGRVDAAGDADAWTAAVTAGDLLSVRCWTDQFGSLAQLRVALAVEGVEFVSSDTSDDADYYVTDAAAPATGLVELTLSDAGGPTGDAAWYRCAMYAE